MTVFDASVYVDALVVVGEAGDVARAALRRVITLEVPAIFGAEATSALRGLVRSADLEPAHAAIALEQIRTVRRVQHSFEPFAQRVWELRDNVTVYDAWYVALAEQLGTDLVTADARLAHAPGPRCPVLHVRDLAG